MKILKYEFNNKLLDNVILLRVILYIYIYIYLFIYIVGGRGSKVVNGGNKSKSEERTRFTSKGFGMMSRIQNEGNLMQSSRR